MFDAHSSYSPGNPRPAWFISSIRAIVTSFQRLERVQVCGAIVLGLLQFASLGVCGGDAQHRQAIRVWRYLIAFAVIAVLGILAMRFPFAEVFAPAER